MFNNFDAYNINNQYGNQISGSNIKQKSKKSIQRLLKARATLKAQATALQADVDRLKHDNERLRRKNDMLTAENCQLKQFAFSFMQQNQNQQIQTFYSRQNQPLNLSNVGCLFHVKPSRIFSDNINNQSITEPTALKVTSPAFIPKGNSQTHSSHNQQQNINSHINISVQKLNYKNKSDDKDLQQLNNLGNDKSVRNINTLQKTTYDVNSYFQNSIVPNLKKITDDCGFCFGKKIRSWLSIEHLRIELEKAKDIIPENPRSLSEKLKNIKASSSQKINKVPNMTSEQEKF